MSNQSKNDAPLTFKDWPEITVYNQDFRPVLHTFYQVITEKSLWEFFKNYNKKEFMLSDAPELTSIEQEQRIKDLDLTGFLEATALQVMKKIAKFGWKQFVEDEEKVGKGRLPTDP